MPAQKTLRANWNKPLKTIHSKAEFDQIQATGTVFPDSKRPLTLDRPGVANKKQIFPAVTKTKALTRCKKLSFLPANYFRTSLYCSQQNLQAYELTEQDLSFIKLYHSQNTSEVALSLNQQIMRKAIVFLEKTAPNKKQQKQELSQTMWLGKLVKARLFDKSQISKCKKMQSQLFNYWKQRRLDCQYPLYRPMWKHMNKQDISLIYRQRTKKKNPFPVSLDLQKAIQQISKQFQHASSFCNKVRANQQCKIKKIQKEVQRFYQDSRHLLSDQEFNRLINLKELGINTTENRGNQKHAQKLVSVKQASKSTVDKFQSIIGFMATLISEIQLRGIQFGRILPQQLSLSQNTHKSYLSKQAYQHKRKQNCFYQQQSNIVLKSELLDANKQTDCNDLVRKLQ